MISIEAMQNAQLCSNSDESSALPLLKDLQTRNKHLESKNEAYISKISEMKQLLQEFTTSIDRSKSCIQALKEDNFNLENVVRDLRDEIHSNKQLYTKEEVKLRDKLESALINEAMLKDKLQSAEEKILLLQGAQTGNNFISLESRPNAIKGSSETSSEVKSNEDQSHVEGHDAELKRLLKELTDAKSKIFYLEEEKVDRDMEPLKLSNNEAKLLEEIQALNISMQESKNDYKILKESFTSEQAQMKALYAQERIRDLERENTILQESKNAIQKKLDDSTKAFEQMKKLHVHENVDLSFGGRSLPVDASIEKSKAIHSNNVIKRISSIIELSELARDQVSIVTNDSESEKKEEYEALFQGIVNTEDKELDRLWAELREARNTIADLEAEKIAAKSTIYRLEEDIVHLREKNCKEPTQTFSSQSNLNKKSIGAFARRLSSGW